MPNLYSFQFAVRAILLAAAIVIASLAGQFANSDEVAKSSVVDKPQPNAEQAAFVRDKVLPLLEARCFECHGPDHEPKGSLRLTSAASMLKGGDSGAAIEPGKPDDSLLIQAVRYENFEMPPRTRLPAEEVAILEQWIRDGAHWPDDLTTAAEPAEKTAFPLQERIAAHWAWKKIEQPPVPNTSDSDWPATDIDKFLFDKLHAAGLEPAPDAERRVILRRLYFDLIGLLPTVEQQDRFLNDPADTPTAIAKLADELLASPHFGERWGRHWLDLVRYAETLGHEFDYPIPHAWQYRDYVIRAINADVPYDQFVREHIAGDLIEKPRTHPTRGFNESIIGTGFWYLGEELHAPVDVKADEALRIDNQIDVFSKTFLGLTVSCARCHDHKFDAITTEDYYALSGFLQSSRRRVEWLDSHEETHQLVTDLRTCRDDFGNLMFDLSRSYDRLNWDRLLTEALLAPSEQHSDPEVTALRTILRDPTTAEYSHPLSLFASLGHKRAEQSDQHAVSMWLSERHRIVELRKSLSHFGEALTWPEWDCTTLDPNRTVVVSQLDNHDLFTNDWKVFGAAFQQHHSTFGKINGGHDGRIGSDNDDGEQWSLFPEPTRPGTTIGFSSASLSHRLKGELHSPEFVLTHPEIHILAAGQKARVRLVIDGYVMNEFSELLFNGCRQPIDTDGAFRWIRLGADVHRHMGHRCHLEFLDEGDGWFSVQQVRFVKQRDEQPMDVPELSHLNLRHVSSDHDRARWIGDWARSFASELDAQRLALQLRQMSGNSSDIDAAMKRWKSVAEGRQEGIPVLVSCDGTGEDEHIFIRGSHKNLGPIATRRLLAALDHGTPLAEVPGSGRKELADRLLADSNPFPARVIVNRVWQHLFGRGIVASSDNFGVLGELPTHPELLDHLADEFRRDGWSVKRLIRRIVTSRAYRMSSRTASSGTRQSSESNPNATEVWRLPLQHNEADPQNKLLHRFPIRRLEGEVIRDAMLSVSGRLDPQPFGAPIPTYLTEFMQGRGRPGESGPLDGAGRRSIYLAVRRNFLNPLLLAFDTPRPASTVGRRSQSNVPAQALILLNNEFVHQQASVWAERLLSENYAATDGCIIAAFHQSLAREPSQEELDALRSLVGEKPDANSLADVCHVLLNHKEFVFVE